MVHKIDSQFRSAMQDNEFFSKTNYAPFLKPDGRVSSPAADFVLVTTG